MPETPNSEQRDKPATLRFDNDLFERRCRERGATSDIARAQLCGVDRATVRRYRLGITVPLLPDAVTFAGRIGLNVNDLWKDAA